MSARHNNANFLHFEHHIVAPWDLGICIVDSGVFKSILLICLAFLLIAGTAAARDTIKPPDTSSPRATCESFLSLTEETARRLSEYRESQSRATGDRFFQMAHYAQGLLDLSQVPPATRREVAIDTLLLVWEVIARVELPGINEIPDASADKDAEKQVREWAAVQSLPFPDFAEDYRKRITDTLDYPPEGSAGADT